MIYKDDKRLIVPFITIWSIIVSLAILSVNREIDKLSESKKLSYQEVLAYDKQQTAFNEAEEIIIPHRKVKISKVGIAHIKQYESLSLIPYTIDDPSKYSIGYGHLIKKSDPLWIKQKIANYRITKKDAEEILRYDINSLVNPALDRIFRELEDNKIDTEELSQGFIDGLGSLIYNCGEEGIRKTEFYSLLKKGKINQAIAKVEITHVYLRGHQIRRLAEANMMNS